MTITPDKIGSVKMTNEGGLAIRLINKTGAPSVKGSVVHADTTFAESFSLEIAGGINPIGVVYEANVADGDPCLVVFSGRAQVLLEDGVASTVGYWCGVSGVVAGRAQSIVSPPATIVHDQEIGHFLESQGSGTDVLAFVILHFR